MTKKSKILFVLHVSPPVHGSSVIGEQIKSSNVINNKFDCTYINLSTSKTIHEIGKNAVGKIYVYIKILLRVFKNLMFFKPELIYLAMTSKGIGFYKDMVIVFLSKIFNKQLVLHFHNKGISDRQGNTLDNFLYKLVFDKSKVILLSDYLFYDVKKYVKREDVYYCANGIKQQNSKSDFSRYQEGQVLFISNIIESKGIYVLLQALSLLQSQNIRFHCTLIGSLGDITENELKLKFEQLNLKGNVSYLGPKYGNEKDQFFQCANIFVHPTLSDCFPLVLLEAASFRLPSVSTNEGAIPEIIDDGETGFIVPKNDYVALAEKLELLIHDRVLRNRLGEKAQQKFHEKYTLEIFEDSFCRILNSIIDTKS